jgi:hypothetical protein
MRRYARDHRSFPVSLKGYMENSTTWLTISETVFFWIGKEVM